MALNFLHQLQTVTLFPLDAEPAFFLILVINSFAMQVTFLSLFHTDYITLQVHVTSSCCTYFSQSPYTSTSCLLSFQWPLWHPAKPHRRKTSSHLVKEQAGLDILEPFSYLTMPYITRIFPKSPTTHTMEYKAVIAIAMMIEVVFFIGNWFVALEVARELELKSCKVLL